MKARVIEAQPLRDFSARLTNVMIELEKSGFEIVNVSHATVENTYVGYIVMYSAVVLYK